MKWYGCVWRSEFYLINSYHFTAVNLYGLCNCICTDAFLDLIVWSSKMSLCLSTVVASRISHLGLNFKFNQRQRKCEFLWHKDTLNMCVHFTRLFCKIVVRHQTSFLGKRRMKKKLKTIHWKHTSSTVLLYTLFI